MFKVQLSTSWLCDSVNLMASVRVFERDTRTVKQVSIPVHGATGNLVPLLPQPILAVGATHNGAPRRRLHGAPKRTMVGVPADTRPWVLRAATQGMRDRRSAVRAQAPNDVIPLLSVGGASLRPLCSDAF